jgi:hypothetical protein
VGGAQGSICKPAWCQLCTLSSHGLASGVPRTRQVRDNHMTTESRKTKRIIVPQIVRDWSPRVA